MDSKGRVTLPSEWRRRHLDKKVRVTLIQDGKEIPIRPVKAGKIGETFDSVPVDLDSDLADLERVKRDLLKNKIP